MRRSLRFAATVAAVFSLSVPSADAQPADVSALGAMAADAVQEAIIDAVRQANR